MAMLRHCLVEMRRRCEPGWTPCDELLLEIGSSRRENAPGARALMSSVHPAPVPPQSAAPANLPNRRAALSLVYS